MAKKKGQRPRGTPHEQSTIRRDQQAPPRQQKLPSGSTPHSETMPGFEGDRFHQTKQASSLPTISRSDQAGTPSLALNERVEIVGDPEARSLADEGDEGAGWTYSPIRPHNSRHLPQSIDNPEDIDWCKTRENAQTLEKKPSYRRQLQIDPKLRGAVESIASRSSFVQARSHLDLSDEPGDSLMVGTIIQHQCQYRCEDVNTPHKAGRRYKIKADVTRFEIKDRFYIVLHKNGRSITEVPIFTYGAS
nr:hypothetical protein B0A51_07629 [Rachicladosporium sp. CCFEE 5018]